MDIPRVCQAMSISILICDPIDQENIQDTLYNSLEKNYFNLLVLKQIFALNLEKRTGPDFKMTLDKNLYLGGNGKPRAANSNFNQSRWRRGDVNPK
jgi:hypothetical protein